MPSNLPPSLPDLLAHTRWVENLARSLVRDPGIAADLAQSTLLIALEREAPPRNARPWLARVLRNQVREWFRREHARPAVESRGAREERLPGADELTAKAESERALVAAVLALEEPYKSTLLLRYFEELSPEEIARRSNTPLSTISSRITRAHAALRTRLGGDDPRGRWLLALTPILAPRAGSLPPPARTLPPGTKRLLLMGTASKLAILAVLGAAALFLVPKLFDERPDPSALAKAPESAPAEPALPKPEVAPPAAPQVREAVATASEAPAVPDAPAAAPPPTGGRIYGEVLRPDGTPAAQRRIRMLLAGRTEKKVVTDAEGRFDEKDLAVGPWAISTWPDKEELAALGKTPQETLDGFVYIVQRTIDLEDGDEVELILGKPSLDAVRVHGRLTLGETPAAGFMSWVPDGKDAMDRLQPAVAGKDGSYEVLLQIPGPYVVIVNHDGATVEFLVDVPRASEHQRDFAIPPITLRGRVTAAGGGAVAGAKVNLTPRGGLNPLHPNSTITFSRTSDAEGRFEFPRLVAARYAVAVSSGTAGESKEPMGARAIREVDLTGGELTEPLAIELQSGARVTGQVTGHEGTGSIPSIYVFDAEGEPLNPISGQSTKKDGSFELFALAPGTYSAIAARGNDWSEVVGFTVPTQGELPSIAMTLRPASKLMVDIAGFQPAWIDVRSANGACLSPLFDKHVFDRTIHRDWSTSVFAYRVPAGEYRIRVAGPAGVLAEKNVVVIAGETLSVDM